MYKLVKAFKFPFKFLLISIIFVSCDDYGEKQKGRIILKQDGDINQLAYAFKVPINITVRDSEASKFIAESDSLSKPLEFSKLVSQNSFRLVRLESNKESLVGEISKIIYTEKGIFVLDVKSTNQLIWFDCDGKFIKSFSTSNVKMKAPQDFDVKDNQLWIIDQESQLFNFSLSNNGARLKSKFKLPFVAFSVKMIDSSKILCSNQSYDYTPFNYLVLNPLDSSITGKALPIKKDYLTKYSERFCIWPSSQTNQILLGVANQDTIYKLNNDTISPYLAVSFGRLGMPAVALESSENFEKFGYKARKRLSAFSMETPKYITSSFSDYFINWIVYNKETSKYSIYKGLGDDLTGGVFNQFPIAAYKDSFIQVGSSEVLLKNADAFKKAKNKNALQNALTNLLSSSTKRDNPLLLIYIPKEIE